MPFSAEVADERIQASGEALGHAKLATVVRAAVASLPARERVAVEMVGLVGCGGPEAGARLGVTKQRVQQWRKRALPKLRRALKLAGCV